MNPACGRALRVELPFEPGVRSSLASCPANPSERTCRVRRAALRTWRAAVPCELLPNVRRRQDFAVVRSWAAVRGNILARCVPRWPSVAIFRRGAFPGGYPWQYSRFMHPRRGLGREKRPSLAAYRRHVSKTSWLWQDMRAMHPKSPTNRLSGMHSAQILPGRGAFHCMDPSNHASCADLAILWRSLPFGGEVPSPEGWGIPLPLLRWCEVERPRPANNSPVPFGIRNPRASWSAASLSSGEVEAEKDQTLIAMCGILVWQGSRLCRPCPVRVTQQLSFLLGGAHLSLRFGGSRQGIRKGGPVWIPL